MDDKKTNRFIARFLTRADKAIEEGIKKADEVLDDAVEFGVLASNVAKKKSIDLKKQAEKEGGLLKKEGLKKISGGIDAAKKAAIGLDRDLEVLERLGKLRKAGIITEKEFQQKKKKILSKI